MICINVKPLLDTDFDSGSSLERILHLGKAVVVEIESGKDGGKSYIDWSGNYFENLPKEFIENFYNKI
ncbi:MAG TPA: hypothetical protein VJB94_00925 [Candidatus Nanoarchaeia archaeon]|nr:hypothetical protein [Candidatus Nanoarchaeia archaeon]